MLLQVMRWCDGSYLEDQDHWWLSGIHRDVFLMRKPAAHLADFEATIALQADSSAACGFQARLHVHAHVRLPAGPGQEWSRQAAAAPRPADRVCGLRVSLHDDAGREVLTACSDPRPPGGDPPGGGLPGVGASPAAGLPGADHSLVGAGGSCHSLEAGVALEAPILWSAERPYLYTLLLTLVDLDGRELEWEMVKLGARDVRIEGKQLLVNGVPITFKGVNRHEHDEATGKVVTEDSMRRDILLMKAHNFNAVRCSHYPNAVRWYELCNELGMYVVDEANIETHGLVALPPPYSRLHLNASPEWRGALMERVSRMVERDKNFTCIVLWSLGNEAGVGPTQMLMKAYLKQRDPSRPVTYEGLGNCTAPATEILVPMYATPSQCSMLVDAPGEERPLILCEYSHAMGNSNGGLAGYWKLFYSHGNIQGGFVWDWADQGLLQTLPDGRRRWAYGATLATSRTIASFASMASCGPIGRRTLPWQSFATYSSRCWPSCAAASWC